MNLISAHSPVFNQDGSIDLVARFDHIEEELPFTASAHDVEEYGREIYMRALAGEFGLVEAFSGTGPNIEELRAAAVLGPMELADKLEALGIFDTVSDWANAQGGKIAYAWNRATQFERLHPLIADAQAALKMTDEQVGALFNINI